MPSELLVSRLGNQTWAALKCRGRIVELHVASPTRPDPVERVVRGRVCAVRPGIGAAFVDIGLERPGYLAAGDPALDTGLPQVGRGLTVQVVAAPSADKGARVTGRVGLPGVRLVCRPLERERKVSRRISDPAERRRLAGVLERCPGAAGWIARSRAAGTAESELQAEAGRLLARWQRIERKGEGIAGPRVLETEPDLLERLLRDLPGDGPGRIVVDTPEDRERVARSPAGAARVELHSGPWPLVEAGGLLEEAARVLGPRVPLPTGGHLVIQQTDALLAIDVNTGGPAEPPGADPTPLATNLEAVAEVARQLRLRDLGGTILVDLIETASADERQRIRDTLGEALRHDRSRTRIVGWSDRRLLHLTRRRTRPDLDALLSRSCPACADREVQESALLVAARVLAGLRRLAGDPRTGAVRVEVHPEVAEELRGAVAKARLPFGVDVAEVRERPPASFDLRPV